ncbi:MAG: hydrogenase iron-sulfur subunit [Desulfatibacillaceae bacterium]|nr:hydrogenase iron-sulfur subunit [Desulfatibacillaceae bacterium]
MTTATRPTRIVLFLCNWSPHAAFQTLLDTGADLPSQIKMVRIPCSGRISKALLFKPFEMGADGVALIGCPEGSCRYGEGANIAKRNVTDTRKILDLLGLGSQRLRLATFHGDRPDELFEFLKDFTASIEEMGQSPVSPQAKPPKPESTEDVLRAIVAKHDVHACQDCGKCTSACSLTLAGKPFSPRAIASALILGDLSDPAVTSGVWSCLTCGLCYDRCPSAVNFPEFIRDVRSALLPEGVLGHEAHGGFFRSLSRTMTCPDLPIRHWDWLPEGLSTDPASPVLFFGGCAPYFDIFFTHLTGLDTKKILIDSIRLLNFFDISPSLLDAERCCGHDLLWSGDKENFIKLARLNVDAIHKMGVKEVVLACPEGVRTLSKDYPANGIEIDFEVTHILDFVEREVDKGAVSFTKPTGRLTFQDSCRLSRHLGRAATPRKLLARLGADFEEMTDRGAGAICCGNCAWMGCDAYSKALQVKRLRQAKATGAKTLVTACPKCQIHLRCAGKDPFVGDEIAMETADLVSILADSIKWT